MKLFGKCLTVVCLSFSVLCAAGVSFEPGEKNDLGSGEHKLKACHEACDKIYKVCMDNIPTDIPLPLNQICITARDVCHEKCGGQGY